MNKKIIAYPDNEMSANEFAYIIKRLRCEALVIVSSEAIKAKFIEQGNISFIQIYSQSKGVVHQGKGKNATFIDTRAIVNKLEWLYQLLSLPLKIVRFYQTYRKFESFFKAEKVLSALIPSDRSYADGSLMPFVYFCKRHGIKTVIPQTAIFANKQGMLTVRLAHQNKFAPNIIDIILFKKYIQSINGVDLIYYHFDVLIIFKMFGVLSNNPWVMGGNSLSTICVNNEQVKNELAFSGVPEENIKVTGSYKYNIEKSSATKSKIRIIGFALPQLYEHNILPWEEHIHSIETVLANLSKLPAQVEVFLHPKMKFSKYQYLESKYDCNIFKGRTDERIPLLDVYIATFSSTVLTSLVYGVPSLVLDSFNANYDMFKQHKSVKIFNSEIKLCHYMSRLIEDREEYKGLLSEVAADGQRVEPFLGCGLENLARELAVEV